MKAADLAEIILRAPTRRLDAEAKIVVCRPGTVGGTPAVSLKSAGFGIDWDNGTFQIYPAEQLTTLSAEDVAAIHKDVVKGGSWHAFQQWKKQDARIKALEAELAALKGAKHA
ncbi:hypothetical protein CY658_04945 [Variovorax sp. RO1]|uniref:hypothetical protein n=1 Tax=Variovorax sp. RO1 TaxID=2066034 RepID=UPI000C716E22|nr:hypothetical protein [Variovorax sp. RO1]PLC06384.1 hypothetical protein CY658_04945 [Variovorax sp. RO1]